MHMERERISEGISLVLILSITEVMTIYGFQVTLVAFHFALMLVS